LLACTIDFAAREFGARIAAVGQPTHRSITLEGAYCTTRFAGMSAGLVFSAAGALFRRGATGTFAFDQGTGKPPQLLDTSFRGNFSTTAVRAARPCEQTVLGAQIRGVTVSGKALERA
jgi:hypothetical protein